MSKFLGPIHNVLFSKIKYLEYIEDRIIAECKKEIGNEIESIVKEVFAKYGEPVSGKQLEDAIDTSNIHGSLQALVNNTESRHAFLIKSLRDKYSNKAFKIVVTTYQACGIEAAALITEPYDNCTAEDLHELITSYTLDGMPSDNINSIIENRDDLVTWRILNNIHQRNFGVDDVKIFYDLRKVLVNVIIYKLNDSFSYTFEITNADGTEYYVQKISKKEIK